MKNSDSCPPSGNQNPAGLTRRAFVKKSATAAALAASPLWLTRYADAADPINLGCIVSLTGYLSDQAQAVVEGMELAADEINAQGGLLGRPVRILVRDDEMKPPTAERRFMELVKNQNIAMFSGVVFAPIANIVLQANKQLGDQSLVMMFVTAYREQQIPQNMQPREFFVGSTLEAFGLAGGEHMAKNVGKKTFILYTDYAWGWAIRDAFLQTAKANGAEILGTLAIPPGTTDFEPFLTQLRGRGQDYVTCVVNGMMFVNLMKQAYAMGLKDQTKFVTFHVNIEEVNACGPEVIKDVFLVTDYFWNLSNEKNRQFVAAYMKKYGTSKRPSMRTFLHHTSVLMWADAVRKVGSVDPKRVADSLAGLRGDYGKGMVEIRKTGDHTTIQPVLVARGKGPAQMKDKFDTQEIVKLYTGEQYFYSPREKGW